MSKIDMTTDAARLVAKVFPNSPIAEEIRAANTPEATGAHIVQSAYDTESLARILAGDRISQLAKMLLGELRVHPDDLREAKKLLEMLQRETAELREMIEAPPQEQKREANATDTER